MHAVLSATGADGLCCADLLVNTSIYVAEQTRRWVGMRQVIKYWLRIENRETQSNA
jgi:hypothetical protein